MIGAEHQTSPDHIRRIKPARPGEREMLVNGTGTRPLGTGGRGGGLPHDADRGRKGRFPTRGPRAERDRLRGMAFMEPVIPSDDNPLFAATSGPERVVVAETV